MRTQACTGALASLHRCDRWESASEHEAESQASPLPTSNEVHYILKGSCTAPWLSQAASAERIEAVVRVGTTMKA